MRLSTFTSAILASLLSCSLPTDFLIDNPIINSVEISTPEFLGSNAQVARFRFSISNDSEIDLCFTGYEELEVLKQPQYIYLGKIGTPIFDTGKSSRSGAADPNTTTYFRKVLFVPSGETVAALAKVNAHDYPIEMVRSDPEGSFFFDLGDQYKTTGSVSVYDCKLIPNDGFFPSVPLWDNPEEWEDGFQGIVNLPGSEPFMFD